MNDLEAILHAYQASIDCLNIVGDLLAKSTKGKTFHNTIFFGKSPNEAQELLAFSKEEQSDSTILSLLSGFEKLVFYHLVTPLPIKASSKDGYSGLNDAIKQYESQVSTPTYNNVQRLCSYRHWVAHGKRWEKPSSADPANTYKCLIEFMNQASIL
ncbi:hypothetical protein ACTRXD_08500 [Nitrospira sp. T9]|uniref:hypothetical protein n=1 Tax=unclassified Nitrospira TaxID=2652172 RepID=UPI003F9470E8